MAKLPRLQKPETQNAGNLNPTMRGVYKTAEGGTISGITELELKKKKYGIVTIQGDETKVLPGDPGASTGEVKAYVSTTTYVDKSNPDGYNKVLRKFEEGIDYNEIYLEGVWTEDPSRRRGKEGVLYLADIK